eukprot:266400_1
MVLGQGWTVSRFEVIYPKLLLFGCIMMALLQCSLYIWLLIGLDDQSTKFAYNTPPVYCYGILFFIVGCIFLFECIYSYKNEPLDSKKSLYISLALFFSFWFMWPLISIGVGEEFQDWTRDVAVQSISITITTLTYFGMMLLMWPTWAHQYFNLSMTDTQERILDAGSATMGDSNKSGQGNKSDYKVLDNERL